MVEIQQQALGERDLPTPPQIWSSRVRSHDSARPINQEERPRRCCRVKSIISCFHFSVWRLPAV